MGSTVGGVVAIAKYCWMELVAKAKFTVVEIISNGSHTTQCALLNPPIAFVEMEALAENQFFVTAFVC